jgi:hypothetical protein
MNLNPNQRKDAQMVGTMFSAGRRKLHARRVRSPFQIASLRFNRSSNVPETKKPLKRFIEHIPVHTRLKPGVNETITSN